MMDRYLVKIAQLDITKFESKKNNKTFGTKSFLKSMLKSKKIANFQPKGGWSWAWNHGGAWPSRWAPWQQPQSGPPSTGRGSSSNNRGAGPSWANTSSQRSWHPRQAANKYNSRWEILPKKQKTQRRKKKVLSFFFLIFLFYFISRNLIYWSHSSLSSTLGSLTALFLVFLIKTSFFLRHFSAWSLSAISPFKNSHQRHKKSLTKFF